MGPSLSLLMTFLKTELTAAAFPPRPSIVSEQNLDPWLCRKMILWGDHIMSKDVEQAMRFMISSIILLGNKAASFSGVS